MNTTPGIVWPQRGKAVYQEDLDFEQISKDDAIVNRTADHYSHGVQFGGEVTIAGAGLISVGPTLAYDIDGKRIHHPSSQSVIVPDGSWIVALRHAWAMSDGVDPDLSGTSVQYRNDSYEIVLRAAAQPGDIPLRSVTFAAGVGTLGADLRSLRAMTVAGDAEVGGDLDVHGHATLHGGATIIGDPVYVDSENVRTKDNEIVLNEGESGAGITAGISGIRMKRGSLADALLRFVEADDRFYAGIDGALEKLAYLADVYTKAQLDAFFEGESAGKKQVDWSRIINPPSIEAQRIANAGGTADAISGTFVPPVTTLTNGLTVYVRAAAANTASGVVFQADSTAAKPIVKGANKPLEIGDIGGAGHWLELQFDTFLDKWVAQNPASAIISSLGLGQTWQDVTSSRSLGTNYTNTTGRAICIIVITSSPTVTTTNTITIAGVVVSEVVRAADALHTRNSAIIPPGAVYSVTHSSGGTLYKWMELR